MTAPAALYTSSRGAFARLAATQRAARPPASARVCRICGGGGHAACANPDGTRTAWVAPDLCAICCDAVAAIAVALDMSPRGAEALLKRVADAGRAAGQEAGLRENASSARSPHLLGKGAKP